MAHRFKAILFDLDGTLIDSVHDLCATMNSLLAGMGRRPVSVAEMKDCTGDGLKVMLDKAFRLTGAPIEPAQIEPGMKRFLEIYEQVIPRPTCIFPGIMDFLRRQKDAGVKMAVVTNKHESASRRLLRQLELTQYFSSVIGGDSCAERKPHPLPLLTALEQIGEKPDHAVMIGDSPNDVLAARAAGIAVLAINSGYTRNWPDDIQPHAWCGGAEEWQKALASADFSG
jgi:phosphoglycolate phosphatase